MIEAAVAIGLADRVADTDIEDLVQAEEDQLFCEAMECLEEELIRGGGTDEDAVENE